MYEVEEYEDILDRMKERVPDDYDTSEGSFLHEALASVAQELAAEENERNDWLDEVFADTASRDYLERRTAEKGIYPYSASSAILKAVSTPVDLEIEIGTRFSLDDLDFAVISKITDGEYRVECETPGAEGNRHLGTMIPIDYVEGLETITATEVLIQGEDAEDTEVFRQRYYDSFESKAFGGNIEDYKQKVNALSGVGATKVTPAYPEAGHVLLTILASDYSAASSSLVDAVQEEVDPTQDGSGLGLAPINHIATVQTATAVTVNVSFTLSLQEGVTFESIRPIITASLNSYLLGLRQIRAGEETTIVRISQIERRVMDVDGVLDISHTALNDVEENLTLTAYQIPVLGTVVDNG